MNAVMPVSDDKFFVNQRQHDSMLRSGDLLIVPGWDQQKWMGAGSDSPAVRRLLLMNMAVAPEGSQEVLSALPDIVREHVRTGGRVIVGRVFDRDQDLMPWYALAETGWPRARIQELLAPFCVRPVGEIDGIVFRELHECGP
jgi:hypothetical protein